MKLSDEANRRIASSVGGTLICAILIGMGTGAATGRVGSPFWFWILTALFTGVLFIVLRFISVRRAMRS